MANLTQIATATVSSQNIGAGLVQVFSSTLTGGANIEAIATIQVSSRGGGATANIRVKATVGGRLLADNLVTYTGTATASLEIQTLPFRWANGEALAISISSSDAADSAVNVTTIVDTPAGANAAQIADAVWDEQYSQHTTAGTFGKLFDIWRKSNPAIDGVVTASVTPTTTTFSTNITGYPSGAFIHSVLLFVNGSTNAESNSPIVGYVSANGVITLEEPMQQAVQVGDEFVIAANSHVHSIVGIAAGIWNSLLATYQAVGSFGKAVADTKADTTTLLSTLQGSTVIQVASPNVSGNLVLTQGDTYDGIGNPKAQWNVTTDYTSGWAVVLTIRDKDDAVIYTNTGTVVSATLISVAIVVPTVTPFEGCPGQWQGKFDVQLTKASSVVTIAIGVVYINEDQTR